MESLKLLASALLVIAGTLCHAESPATSIPSSFESAGADREAIQLVLDTYARAVTAKDETLFETLLLNKDIPFSHVGSAIRGAGAPGSTAHYDEFKRGVFGGAPFTQRFQDVHISQDGPLANVSLVFVNSATDGTRWGWKTLQLLKVAGKWKIASEFYTGH